MTGILGPRAAVDVMTAPLGVDGGRLLAFTLRSGKTASQVLQELAAAVGVVNQQLAAKFSKFIYFTDSPAAYYPMGTGGGRRKTPVKVEFKQADAVRSSNGAHMLPLTDFEDALGWTPLYMRDAWDAQLRADVNLIVESWNARVHEDFYTRALTNTEFSEGSGYNVPWAIGTGVSVPYIPEGYGSYTFDSTHTHFIADSGTATSDYEASLELAAADLRHHGYTGRLYALVSEADVAKYAASDKFVRYVPAGVVTVAGNSNAPIFVAQGETTGMPGETFGLFLTDTGPTIILQADPYMPTGYALVAKSFGDNNPMNPLALRVHPSTDFGLRLDPRGTNSLVNPELEKVLVMGTHGVGVNNRNGAVALHWGNASWTNPSFS